MIRHSAYLAYYFLFNQRMYRSIREIRASQHYSPNEYKHKQKELLTKLLTHAFSHVPYYKSLTTNIPDTGLTQAPFEVLQSLPILTKEIIRENDNKLIAPNLSYRRQENSTSGTTGTSMYFLSDKNAGIAKTAYGFVQCDMMKVPMLSKRLTIWSARFDVDKKVSVMRRFLNKTKNSMLIYADLSERGLEEMVAIINKYKPVIISSYPSTLEFIAQAECCSKLTHFPKAIIVSGEKLYDYQRTKINRVFHSECFDFYGARDGSMIAHECSAHDGLHVFGQNVLVEVVDDDNKPITEGVGRILITDLHNYVMPFIRYEIGDLAEVSPTYLLPCRCGSSVPRIKQIISRTFDIVRFPNGTAVAGTYWTLLMRSQPGIHKFKVSQKVDGSIEISFVKNSEFSESSLRKILNKISEKGGEQTQIKFQEVTDIPSHPESGKYRFVESDYHP